MASDVRVQLIGEAEVGRCILLYNWVNQQMCWRTPSFWRLCALSIKMKCRRNFLNSQLILKSSKRLMFFSKDICPYSSIHPKCIALCTDGARLQYTCNSAVWQSGRLFQKNKKMEGYRSRLQPKDDVTICLTTSIHPRIDKLCDAHQGQTSH